MTRLPNPNQQRGTWRVQPQTSIPNPLSAAPGREIYEVVRKTMPNGRVFEWIYQQGTALSPTSVWETRGLLQSPTGDCGCELLYPDDVVCCSDVECQAAVCARRHSASCQNCGKIFCSACLKGIVVESVPAICCRPCAEKLTSPLILKIGKGIKSLIWSE